MRRSIIYILSVGAVLVNLISVCSKRISVASLDLWSVDIIGAAFHNVYILLASNCVIFSIYYFVAYQFPVGAFFNVVLVGPVVDNFVVYALDVSDVSTIS